jgi:hypothetical protein
LKLFWFENCFGLNTVLVSDARRRAEACPVCSRAAGASAAPIAPRRHERGRGARAQIHPEIPRAVGRAPLLPRRARARLGESSSSGDDEGSEDSDGSGRGAARCRAPPAAPLSVWAAALRERQAAVQVACGAEHSIVLTADGSVYAFGAGAQFVPGDMCWTHSFHEPLRFWVACTRSQRVREARARARSERAAEAGGARRLTRARRQETAVSWV